MGETKLGVLSIGVYLPPDVRKNDWWPEHVVQQWKSAKSERSKNPFRREKEEEKKLTRGLQLVQEAGLAMKDDPFGGIVERRVRPEGMKSSEMEIAAARDAIARAGIDPAKIDLVLTTSQGPDTLLVANAALVHHALGLRSECIATGVEGVCNSLPLQLTFAESLLRAGMMRYALLIQSCSLTSVVRTEDPFSPWFGDAATAVLVGPVKEGGLEAIHHETDGSFYSGMLVGDPERPWFRTTPRIYVADFQIAKDMATSLPDFAARVIGKALEKSNIKASDVNFLATHQGFQWIRPVVQEIIGAPQAKHCDTFAWTASVGASNVPLCLAMGEREGLLQRGEVVACLTGGAGTTFAGTVLRW